MSGRVFLRGGEVVCGMSGDFCECGFVGLENEIWVA